MCVLSTVTACESHCAVGLPTGNDILEFTAFDNRKQTAKTAAAALALRYFEKYFGLNLETVKREHVASFEYAWGSMPQPPSKVSMHATHASGICTLTASCYVCCSEYSL